MIHRQISSLHYHRIGVATLDAHALIDQAGQPRITAANPAIRAYLAEISNVTIVRKARLAVMARLHTAGLVVAGVLLLCLMYGNAASR